MATLLTNRLFGQNRVAEGGQQPSDFVEIERYILTLASLQEHIGQHRSYLELGITLNDAQNLSKIREMKNDFGDTVLHQAWHTVPSNIAPIIMQVLIALHPKALNIPNRAGYLPLHSAVTSRLTTDLSLCAQYESSESFSVIERLVKIYPRAVDVCDKYGNMPLHLAVQNSANNIILFGLINSSCKALMHRNQRGMIPLHIACCQTSCSVSNISLLINSYPRGLSVKDSLGRIPLAVALESEASDEIINYLLETMTDKKLFKVQDKEGRLPIHIALDMFCQARWMRRKQTERIKKLLALYPQSILIKDMYGRIPLHVALDRGVPDELIQILIQHAPHTIESTNRKGLLPWELAVYNNNNSSETIYYLLQRDPSFFIADMMYEKKKRQFS